MFFQGIILLRNPKRVPVTDSVLILPYFFCKDSIGNPNDTDWILSRILTNLVDDSDRILLYITKVYCQLFDFGQSIHLYINKNGMVLVCHKGLRTGFRKFSHSYICSWGGPMYFCVQKVHDIHHEQEK